MHKRYLSLAANIFKGVALFSILASAKPSAFFLLNTDTGECGVAVTEGGT
jgi:hypothetical protein